MGGGVHAPALHHDRLHAGRQQLCKRALGALVCQKRKIVCDALVELLPAQRRLQIDSGAPGVLFHVFDVARGREGERSRDAKVGKQHFPQLAVYRLCVPVKGQGHVAQRKAHHLFTGGIRAHQAAKARHGRHNGVPRLFCQLVAVPGGTGARVGNAPRGHQHRIRQKGSALFGANARAAAAFQQELPRAARLKPRAGRVAQKGGAHIFGPVAHREHPAAPFGLERHAQPLEQLHRPGRRKGVQRRVEKAGVGAHILQKGLLAAVVGQVAAAFSGNQDLFARQPAVLQKGHGMAAFQRGAGGHQPRGARPNDQQVHWFFLQAVSTAAALNKSSSGCTVERYMA